MVVTVAFISVLVLGAVVGGRIGYLAFLADRQVLAPIALTAAVGLAGLAFISVLVATWT